LPVDVSSKSMVWYRPQTLAGIGATPPNDWAGLLGLADTFVADGQTPFAIGAESGGASGWPLTDIFENLLVRTGGPAVHRRLVEHRIAWTDPAVFAAMQRFTDIVGDDAYVAGGAAGILTTSFTDAIDMVLGASPSATMYFGANWVQWFIDPALTPLVDYNYFPFPEIDSAWGAPMTGGGDVAVLFEASGAAQAFMQFLATPTAGELWVSSASGHISPNSGVSLDVYTNPITRAVAQQLSTASDFLFDLDDQLPYELQTYLWGQLMYFVAHQDQIPVVLQRLEQRATELQGAPYSVFMPLAARAD
jgi:alpha-glucoside transport system substrate-binding protein